MDSTYDESQDIDALLRSSLRGEETNPPGVDGGVAESAETAARRRRIRFDVDSLEEGQELSDELVVTSRTRESGDGESDHPRLI